MKAIVVVAVALAFAATAAAKGPLSGTVCGGSGCRTVDQPELLNPIDGHWFSLASAPRPAPYFVVFLSSPEPNAFCWRMIWVPRRAVLRIENVRPYVSPVGLVAKRHWRTVHRDLAARLNRGVRGVEPFGPARRWPAPRPRCAR